MWMSTPIQRPVSVSYASLMTLALVLVSFSRTSTHLMCLGPWLDCCTVPCCSIPCVGTKRRASSMR